MVSLKNHERMDIMVACQIIAGLTENAAITATMESERRWNSKESGHVDSRIHDSAKEDSIHGRIWISTL